MASPENVDRVTNSLVDRWDRGCDSLPLLQEADQTITQLHAAVKTAQELAATRLMEIERLQMRLKRHEPVSLYNGHDIDWWKKEAERRAAALQKIVNEGDYTAPEGMKRIAQAALSGSNEPGACGIKCTHCNGKGTKLQVFDAELFDGWSPEDEPCETCNGAGRITTVEQYLKTLPADWHQDSSVETWFPMLNEEVERLRRAEKSCMEHHISQGASRDASSGEG